mgnify:CR=1 FL=1
MTEKMIERAIRITKVSFFETDYIIQELLLRLQLLKQELNARVKSTKVDFPVD